MSHASIGGPLQELFAGQRTVSVAGMRVLREFGCDDNPLDIFEAYVDFGGARLRSCRRWFGQGPNKYGEWLNSRVVFRGDELDYGDDPRIFLFQGKVCLVANVYSVDHGFRTHLIEFQGPDTWVRYFLMPPKLVEPGKNWSPLQLPDGRLAFVHSFSPLRLLIESKRERGVILLSQTNAPGIAPEEGDAGGFPAHRGGTNGVTSGNFVFGVGHTTRRATNNIGNAVISPGCYYYGDEQLIHRPFFWCIDSSSLEIVHGAIDFNWDPRFWIVDPTSLILDPRADGGFLYTTEVERSFVDPSSAARTVEYRIEFR
jgi:hypothetical protein